MRNTYINAQLLSTLAPLEPTAKDGSKAARVQWVDNKSESKQQIATVIPDLPTPADTNVGLVSKALNRKPIMKPIVPCERNNDSLL